MASVMNNKAINLLIFISILLGTQSVSIEHKTEVKAAVGQNVSLPCIVSKEDAKIIQLQWHKKGELGEQILVLFNPIFPAVYYANVTLEVVKTMELRGSILHLQEVTEKDSGDYICDITTFPYGNIKNSTKVQVAVPMVSMNITSPDRTVIEGDTVSITCVSDPQPDKYMLLSSLSQSIIRMESQDGKFIIQNISRHVSDLICQPFWSSSNQHLQSLKTAVNLTVDFLDNIECDSESQIQVETGTNLTITCDAKSSSSSLHFVWTKNNMTLSSSASINLWSVSLDRSGTYTLIVHSGNHSHLHRQKDFTVTVMNRTHTEHQSSTMTMETTPQISGATMTTPESSVTMLTITSQSHHTSSATDAPSTEEVMHTNTSAPSTGNVTMVHVHITTPHTGLKSSATTFTHTSSEGRTLSEICCTSSAGSSSREITMDNYVHSDTNIFTSPSTRETTVRISNVLTTKITRKDMSITKSHVVFVIIPFLLVLVLIGFLYRQYLIQKRLDMPPPFKPPPPPVKYTSARNHDIPTTDSLV